MTVEGCLCREKYEHRCMCMNVRGLVNSIYSKRYFMKSARYYSVNVRFDFVDYSL